MNFSDLNHASTFSVKIVRTLLEKLSASSQWDSLEKYNSIFNRLSSRHHCCGCLSSLIFNTWTLFEFAVRRGFMYIPWCFRASFYHADEKWRIMPVTSGGFSQFLTSLFYCFCVSLVSGVCLHCYNKLYKWWCLFKLNAGRFEVWKLK